MRGQLSSVENMSDEARKVINANISDIRSGNMTADQLKTLLLGATDEKEAGDLVNAFSASLQGALSVYDGNRVDRASMLALSQAGQGTSLKGITGGVSKKGAKAIARDITTAEDFLKMMQDQLKFELSDTTIAVAMLDTTKKIEQNTADMANKMLGRDTEKRSDKIAAEMQKMLVDLKSMSKEDVKSTDQERLKDFSRLSRIITYQSKEEQKALTPVFDKLVSVATQQGSEITTGVKEKTFLGMGGYNQVFNLGDKTEVGGRQKYSSGGVVPGNSYRGDKIKAGLNSGEMVLNTQQQKILLGKVNKSNASSGGNTYHVQVNVANALSPHDVANAIEKKLNQRDYNNSKRS
jgi:hypothetical protein